MDPQVLVLGLPRTGTQSIAIALTQLGIGPIYHMKEVAKRGDEAAWTALIDQKLQCQTVVPGALNDVLRGFAGLADFPATIFPLELIQAYPKAKVILVKRDIDGWMRSMQDTLIHAYNGSTSGQGNSKTALRIMAEKYHQLCWQNDFAANGRTFFERYYQDLDTFVAHDRA